MAWHKMFNPADTFLYIYTAVKFLQLCKCSSYERHHRDLDGFSFDIGKLMVFSFLKRWWAQGFLRVIATRVVKSFEGQTRVAHFFFCLLCAWFREKAMRNSRRTRKIILESYDTCILFKPKCRKYCVIWITETKWKALLRKIIISGLHVK